MSDKKMFTENEVKELLKKQIDACSDHLERETYPLRSPTPNPHTKKWVSENIHTIVKQTPLIKP